MNAQQADSCLTLAERLGFRADSRVLIVHADDVGMCNAANRGSFEAMEQGVVTCGSLMVPCPWFAEAAAHVRANPRLDLGVHLTLNSEWQHYRWQPVLGPRAVPSLVDRDGFFPRTILEVMQNARADEVEAELRAQIDRALDAGVDVTHLDAHMFTVSLPRFIGLFARLGADYRLPLALSLPKLRPGVVAKGPMAEVRKVLNDAAIPNIDYFDAESLSFADGTGDEHCRNRLLKVQPGVTFLICHPAKASDELSAIASKDAHCREFERSYFTSAACRETLAAQGINLIGMRELRHLVRNEAPLAQSRAS